MEHMYINSRDQYCFLTFLVSDNYNRVVLDDPQDEAIADYINASRIQVNKYVSRIRTKKEHNIPNTYMYNSCHCSVLMMVVALIVWQGYRPEDKFIAALGNVFVISNVFVIDWYENVLSMLCIHCSLLLWQVLGKIQSTIFGGWFGKRGARWSSWLPTWWNLERLLIVTFSLAIPKYCIVCE